MTALVVCITCGQPLDDAAPLCPCDRERLARAISRRLAETGPAPQAQTELERVIADAARRAATRGAQLERIDVAAAAAAHRATLRPAQLCVMSAYNELLEGPVSAELAASEYGRSLGMFCCARRSPTTGEWERCSWYAHGRRVVYLRRRPAGALDEVS